MSRTRLVAGLAAVLLVVAAVWTVLVVVRRDTTTVIDLEQARAVATSTSTRVDASRVPSAEATPTIPLAGPDLVVYVYAMSGHEEIDALGGARHEYPAEAYLTVRAGGCGEVWRWQAIEERWLSWDVCDSSQVTVAGFDSFNKWFGTEDLQRYRCDEPVPLLPPVDGADSWTFACATADITQETVAEVVGLETVNIAGVPLETIHIRYTDTLSGDSTGGGITDRWFRLGDPLVVKEIGATASAAPSLIGTVNYVEEYEIVLEAIEPLGP